METNLIIKGDCIRGMRKLPADSIQVIVTSPPYNVQRNYKGYKDSLSWSAYYSWLLDVFEEAYRILNKGGLLFINISNSAKNQYKAFEVTRILRTVGFNLVDTVIWHKTIAMPCTSPSLLTNAYEFIFIFAKSHDYYFDKDSIKVPSKHSDKLKCRTNVWSFSPVIKNQHFKFNHCAMFPEELPKLCILLGSKPNDIVLDPFMGSGTTAVVAKRLNRRYIGFEISEEYAKICKKRLAEVQT